jgi:CDP-diglyceride synthetase
MPATMVGDSWRRFGWIGVAALFCAWSWFLAKISLNFRFTPQHLIPLMVGMSLAAEIWFDYISDMITLVNTLPRHIVIMVAYSVVVWCFQLLLARRAQYLAKAMSLRPASGNLATSDVPFTRR